MTLSSLLGKWHKYVIYMYSFRDLALAYVYMAVTYMYRSLAMFGAGNQERFILGLSTRSL